MDFWISAFSFLSAYIQAQLYIIKGVKMINIS